MSPSREVCCSQWATARSASCHWPVSRPCTRRVVRTGAGVARLPLEVAEPGVHGLPDHVVDLGDQGGPVLVAFVVAGLAGQAGVLAEGGVEDRDGFGQRDRQVEEQRALPGLLDGFGPQLAAAFGGGVRLGGQQRSVQVGGFPAAARWSAERPCRRGPCVRRTAGRRACVRPSGRARGRGPGRRVPTSGRAARRRSRWPGCNTRPRPSRGRGRPASRCSPGRIPCSASRQPPLGRAPPRPGWQNCPCSSDDAWVWRLKSDSDHDSRVTKRPIKIRNEKRTKWDISDRAVSVQVSFAKESEPLTARLSHRLVFAI